MSSAARRWEITVLLGPCSDSEAEKLMEDVADFVYSRENFGACVGMSLENDGDSPQLTLTPGQRKTLREAK